MPSIRFRRFVNAHAENGDAIVGLFTFNSPELSEPLYLSSDVVPITSLGRTFMGANLDFTVPGHQDNARSQVTIALQGISPQLIKAMDDHPFQFEVTLELILRSTPDVIEGGPWNLRSQRFSVDYKTNSASLECEFHNTLDLPLIRKRYTLQLVPGAFGAGTE